MLKAIVSNENMQFLYRNAAVVKKDGRQYFALPVFSKEETEKENVIEMPTDTHHIGSYAVENANKYIELTVAEKGKISDGYHTFDELYDHRIMNFILLCRSLAVDEYAPIWRSKVHSDGKGWEGWFIMGINSEPGEQISYHLPMKYWDMTKFATEYDTAPPFDGHTSNDVLVRLEKLLSELD